MEDIQKVERLKDVKALSRNLGIFANYIFDITPMEHSHPQGYRIIDSIRNRDFDRYVYGMYATERAPFIQPHAHSFKALDLLDSHSQAFYCSSLRRTPGESQRICHIGDQIDLQQDKNL